MRVPPQKKVAPFCFTQNMIDTTQSNIDALSVHTVGNSSLNEELTLSKQPLLVGSDSLKDLLLTYFFSNFNSHEYYNFSLPEDDSAANPIFTSAKVIFQDSEALHGESIRIAEHLYGVSQHHNIKSGDLYVARFSGIIIDNKPPLEVVGLFKCENKETYLKLQHEPGRFNLSSDEGINIRKLDKGCLILNLEEDAGYKVLIVDNANKSDAVFWKDTFLNVRPWSDAFHHTHNFMNLTRQYVGDQLDEEFSVSKADKIDLLNRSMNFFKSRDQFNQHEFEAEVLEDASVIESFRKYERSFLTEGDVTDNFEISAQAVKRQARIFKSVLKLDKNFHIYIHGNRDLIEKGFDGVKHRHYYKIYFDKES